MATPNFKPDITSYLHSITEELFSVQNRIRNLARHWATDGEHKEAALRLVLRRHLPSSLCVGRGFIVTKEDSSTQIDVLIVNADQPMLFRDGDLMIVTHDTVKAIVEVKTKLGSVKPVSEAIAKLLDCAALSSTTKPWTGLFIYEDVLDHDSLLEAVKKGSEGNERGLDFLSSGKDKFVMQTTQGWSSYEIKNSAPAAFVACLALDASGGSKEESGCVWLPADAELTQNRKATIER